MKYRYKSQCFTRRVLFQPETERIVTGSGEKNGKVVQKYVNTKTLVKDVTFEELHENQYSAGSNSGGSNTSTGGNGGGTGNGGSTGTVTPSTGGGDNGGNSGSGDNNGGGNNTGDNN